MRTVSIALLVAAWFGASLLLSATVAPTAFAVLPSRTLAGAVLGPVFPVLFIGGLIAGLLAIADGALTSSALGYWRAGAGIVMTITSGIAQFVILPSIERVRATIAGAVDALAPDDARRQAFGRLHGLSVACLGVAMLAAAVFMVCAAIAPAREPV
ncbi:MAG TPA: DUF4149 domain-containing protein [Gemmatimonadaceae bacterium]|jgi:hypothetical protein|nr:DUF4149 domain-containing protein [Gemmatimonadaceae bacterium]